MTAKEKAKELYMQFHVYDWHDGWILNDEETKDMALKALREITSALYDYGEETMELQGMDREFAFWDKVETELMNL